MVYAELFCIQVVHVYYAAKIWKTTAQVLIL